MYCTRFSHTTGRSVFVPPHIHPTTLNPLTRHLPSRHNLALYWRWRANEVSLYPAHIGSRLPYYITDYMTKHERCEQDDLWKDIFSHTKSLGTNATSLLLQSVKSRQAGERKLQIAYLATNYTVSRDKPDLQTYSMLTMWKEFWNLQPSWKSYWNIIQNQRSYSYLTVCRTFMHSGPTH